MTDTNTRRAKQRSSPSIFVICLLAVIALAVYVSRSEASPSPGANDSYVLKLKYAAVPEQVTAVNDKQILYAQYSALFQQLRDWDWLSEQDRLAALTELARMESAIHGISPPDAVSSGEMEGSLQGFYRHAERTIYISASLLQTGSMSSCVSTLLHEFHHYWAHRLCELVDTSVGWNSPLAATEVFDRARVWKMNMETYQTCEEAGFETYQAQPLEADARAFAEAELIQIQQLMQTAA